MHTSRTHGVDDDGIPEQPFFVHFLATRRFFIHNGKSVAAGVCILDIPTLMAFCAKNDASDLHLSVGLPPMIRVKGEIKKTTLPDVQEQELVSALAEVMAPQHQSAFRETFACDFAFDIAGVGRCRANVFKHYRGTGCVIRLIVPQIRTLDALGLPKILGDFIVKPHGLILITGPTGSGKSTTQNAMILHRNSSTYSHIITIEDPIEHVHTPIRSVITQRELGSHTQSTAEALKSALREDPDVIVVGEMRDLDTIRLALRAAETGHLVVATLHTSSAPKTIDRIMDVFPGNEKDVVRNQLSESLVAVWSQRVCWSLQKQAVIASELLIGTPAVRNLIREGKVAQLYSTMQAGSNVGMYTLDYSLLDLVNRKIISVQEARSKALYPESFGSLVHA